MVDIKYFIYPSYDYDIYRELLENGIKYAYSFGDLNLGKVKVIGKGKTGIVALISSNRVIKIRRSDSPKETLELEAKIQQRAFPSSPKIYHYGKNFIIMDYIEGRKLRRNDRSYLIDLLKRAKYLEDVYIEHMELSRPWSNVIVSTERTYIIDYDSASFKEKPYNVTKILSAFKLNDIAKEYKLGKLDFDKIISILS
ncbi:serine/threonine protein kinase [Acidianus brierleyi]|uniref:Serine/threonine protein kinase n=1 Tax=Acidianus brierleyi TaxID=41673 RepID=A0A2U9IIZ1_9CREN|nr:serine/threonine protein kinase [Acidianus brierleyi]AWR95997.1 serine/threonine protein kinase [Acidianus brierleyi]